MTPTIAEIEARLQAATPGEWVAVRSHTGATMEVHVDFMSPLTGGWRISEGIRLKPDAQFIAHAPTDMRHLLSEYHAARQRVSELERGVRELLKDSECYCVDNVAYRGPCQYCKLKAAMQKGAV
jgi:hypothetical protein